MIMVSNKLFSRGKDTREILDLIIDDRAARCNCKRTIKKLKQIIISNQKRFIILKNFRTTFYN